MDIHIFDPLPYELDSVSLLAKLRAREDSPQAEQVGNLIAAAEAIARPKAMYKVAFIDARGDDFVVAGGVRFTSRVLRVNLDPLHRFFAFVGTSGRELAAWVDSKEELLEHFYADAISEAVLHAAMTTFVGYLTERFQLSRTSVMNPGSLTDWPLREQRPLFGLLGDVKAAIGVELTDTLLMVPAKSVSGIVFVTEGTFASCQLCPRLDCPNRRAVYDPGMLERRYAEAGN